MPRGRSKTQAYAQRTDLAGKVPTQAPSGMPYGEAKTLTDAQKAMPLTNPAVPAPVPGEQPAMTSKPPLPTPVPLSEFSQRPHEDVLTGLNTTKASDPDLQRLKALQPVFEAEALAPDAPEVFRQFTKWLRTQ